LKTAGGAAMLAALSDATWARGAFADCAGPTINDATAIAFRKGIAGEVIFPNSPQYAAARLLYNRRFSPRPALIVRALNELDVAHTIDFARDNGMRLATRSGGHSYIGASGSNGIILDLSLMNAVTPLGGASFRIGAGTKLVRAYGELACNGNWTLPCGSCDSVGFAGIALGGGFGYLQREHGLTCDRVRAVRMVRADGVAVRASADSEQELFWALRGGGGGSFGVVTEFEVEAVPLQTLRVSGWRWPVAAADDALARFHELLATGVMPRNTLPIVVFNIDAAAAQPACVGLVITTGSPKQAQAAKELLVGAGGVPRLAGSDFGYDMAGPTCNPLEPSGFEYYKAKSSIVAAPPASDAGARIVTAMAARIASPEFSLKEYATVNFLGLRGAVADIAPGATAFPHRSALSEVQYIAYWNQASKQKEAANLAWIRSMYAEVDPRLSLGGAGSYINYADDDLAEGVWQQRAFGPNHPRLQQVKRAVDPTDFFRGKQTIRL
jgi:FAD/FMN-containing dehydrogenase